MKNQERRSASKACNFLQTKINKSNETSANVKKNGSIFNFPEISSKIVSI